MKENISQLNISKGISFYLSEYFIYLLCAISLVGITAGSHNIGIPLYKINPMHWVLYFMILHKKPVNISILFLAFALPFTSTILTGYPHLIKSILMGIEMSFYGIFFKIFTTYYFKTTINAFILSQIIGHFIYYTIKYILIEIGLMNSMLFTSSIFFQIVVILVLGLTLHFSTKLSKNN